MTSLSSGDHPEDHTNGEADRQHKNMTGATASELAHQQTLADTDQTLADAEQTLADTDQAGSEDDQSSADSDQDASDRDQAASDRDLAHGVDPEAHGVSRDIRQRTARHREETAAARLESANQRDATAHTRDAIALARDHAAAARDVAMAQQDATYDHEGARAVTGAEIVVRAAEQRRCAVQHRVQAAAHRSQAAADRQASGLDREQGARDRLTALADRLALADALALTENDPLTGARTRAAGLTDLGHEIDRCRRADSTLVVVYVDAIGLKSINDSEGHRAGDELLKRTVAVMTEHLRSYDLIVRLGGDEFLCVLSNMEIRDARKRFSAIMTALAGSGKAGSIRTGFAQSRPGDTAIELIARADDHLLATRSD